MRMKIGCGDDHSLGALIALIGVWSCAVLLQLSFYAFIIWAVCRLVMHFTA